MPRPIDHYVVKVFKSRLNGKTVIGFYCHCGHESRVQFPDYQALFRIQTVPNNICSFVIAAWRAHTKDLDGVHPNAEDQIRDFFTQQLEQPGGPTMTAPRYPLTAIPINTPKPKSIAISAYVDDAMHKIIVDYAEKLGISVDPYGETDWAVGVVFPSGLQYNTERCATAPAMREYLARLLYGDEGLVENLQADEAKINKELDEVETDLRREEAEQPISFPNEVSPPLAIATETRNDFANDPELTTKQAPSSDRPTRIIMRSYAADDKPRIERLLGLARQLQIPVQLAGPWSCTAFPKGEEAHPALDVAFPEVLVHPRDLLICEGDEKRLFVPSLTEAENQLLWAAREEDQRFITSLIELLGLHAKANREDIAAAVEQRSTVHPGWMECNAMDDRIRDILGAVYGEETDEAARRFAEEREKERAELVKKLEQPNAHEQDRLRRLVTSEDLDAQVRRILVATYEEKTDEAAKRVMSAATEWRTSILTALGLPPETSIDQVVETIEKHGETNAVKSHHLTECHRQRTRYEECDAQVRDILGAAKGEESVDAAKRVMKELVEWKRGQESWKNDATTQRQETAENQRKLLAILNAGTVDPSWQRCLDCAEARMANARKFEEDVNAALGIHPAQSPHSALQRAKWLKEQDKYQTEQLNAIHVRMLDILGPNAGIAWPGIFDSVEKAVKAEADNKELGVKLSQANLTLERLRATLSATEKDRDDAKERIETAITAERQTIAQRIDLALTDKADCTNLDEMISGVHDLRSSHNKMWVRVGNLTSLHTRIADAIDAPPGERPFLTEDGLLNTALVDRIVGYYKHLYTAAGYSEPPQGGWEELLTHIRKYTGFKPETPVTWPKYLIKPDNSKE